MKKTRAQIEREEHEAEAAQIALANQRKNGPWYFVRTFGATNVKAAESGAAADLKFPIRYVKDCSVPGRSMVYTSAGVARAVALNCVGLGSCTNARVAKGSPASAPDISESSGTDWQWIS